MIQIFPALVLFNVQVAVIDPTSKEERPLLIVLFYYFSLYFLPGPLDSGEDKL